MDFGLLLIMSVATPIVLLLAIIAAKMIAMKEIPDSRYTPFDYITGQSPVEIHQHKNNKEENDEEGDDKDKNKRKPFGTS
ncbi:DUF3951 domain-containing protein [Paenibacillus spongiae]|uniref:DUF3951 domain-containing protein n=1 Tax=Paenibacillus spongiae TaxID=2909671 RepID=A0ABY5SFE2_9BACL|nr:DUF3951 domain-containing protein [Paenibacillus spongiae]UVI32696.1 DUF3951 domain-containing protein [Paenibacillus spongiae]